MNKAEDLPTFEEAIANQRRVFKELPTAQEFTRNVMESLSRGIHDQDAEKIIHRTPEELEVDRIAAGLSDSNAHEFRVIMRRFRRINDQIAEINAQFKLAIEDVQATLGVQKKFTIEFLKELNQRSET